MNVINKIHKLKFNFKNIFYYFLYVNIIFKLKSFMNEKNKKKTYAINNNSNDKIKSIEGYNCVGPCYPPNTYYYNPLDLSLISNPYTSCPIEPIDVVDSNGKIVKKKSDKCDDTMANKGNLYFDVFSDYIQISTSADNFLSQIYNLNNISDVVHFLSDSIDTLPIYSQRRLLGAIFEVYYKYVEFPKLLFCKKLLIILKNIYKMNDLDENKIKNKLNDTEITNNSKDLYSIFY